MTVVINGTSGVTTNSGTLISASTIGVGNTTPSASGAGITFPATQSASSDANTLDDYEEGTWTPVDTSGAGLSIVINSATYTKVGRVVFVSVYFSYPVTANGVTAAIGGLPYSASSNANVYCYLTGRCGYTAGGQVVAQVTPGGTQVQFYTSTAASLTNANLSNQYLILTGYYLTNT